MKRKILFILIAITFYGCQELSQITPIEDEQGKIPLTRSIDTTSDYYWSGGVKIPLIKSDDKYYVIMESIESNGLEDTAINSISAIQTIDNYKSLGVNSSNAISRSMNLISFTMENTSQLTLKEEDIVYIAPYFKATNGSEIGITNIINVQLIGEYGYTKLQKIADECNLEMLGKNALDSSIYILSCSKESKGNALEMANLIYESGICKYATPEFIIESSPDIIPTDPYFSNQWNLLNNSNPEIDIDYLNTIEKFSFPYINNVIIAVIDNGIYPDHEDLSLHNVSYNAHTGDSPSGLYGDHGTMVSGVIGATANNNIGITGVASGVKIMPISICYTKDGERLNIPSSTSNKFANAIRFAANNGAHIINNSWFFDTINPIDDINSAIEYAQSKGCIVVFSSGNNSGVVSQPAGGSPSETLIIGSINPNGNRSLFSNYGATLDLVAPGSGIWTTTWTGGYGAFDGTSFAAPHVAATAALMLSVNPYLTSQEVCNIIERTARKLPHYTFSTTSDRQNGTWNNEVGYGLINCYDAVSQAYYSNYDNYAQLIEFDYTGQEISIKVKATDDIAVIWDWDAKEISYIHGDPDSPVETTLTHTYMSSGTRHVSIAECIAPGESAPARSSALREFKFPTAESAKSINIKSVNDSLKVVEIVGGENFESQRIRIVGLVGLESLFLRHLPSAQINIGICPNLRYLSTSPTIWIPNNVIYPGTVMPNIVIGDQPIPRKWPEIPVPVKSIASLNMSTCPKLEQISLENVNMFNVNFSLTGNLQYIYLSSQSDRIVSAPKSGIISGAKGGYLLDAVKSLPPRVEGRECAIVIREVNIDATEYEAVEISRLNYLSLMSHASNNHWNVYWESGYELQ